jgi:hypothetical protein
LESLGNRAARAMLAVLAMALLAACGSPPPASVPISTEVVSKGIALSRTLPSVLPSKAVPIPHSQFVLIPSESAAGMLMPIPFVSEAIASAMDHSAAEAFEARYASVGPYRIALAEMEASPLFRKSGGALTLQPFVFMTECVDDRYRLALVFHLQAGDWIGRYMVHLPTTYAISDFKAPSAALLGTLQAELAGGARVLRQLVERVARGELKSTGVKADVGSLHLVGGKAAGLISPTVIISKGADVLEESDSHVIVRMAGEMSNAGTAGGLFFGVHYFHKDQLHTFRKN